MWARECDGTTRMMEVDVFNNHKERKRLFSQRGVFCVFCTWHEEGLGWLLVG
jgi:hypothetical protein